MKIRALLVSAMVLAVSAARAQAPPPADADFAVATYNINYGNADIEGVVRSIRASGADLVALQETNRQSEVYLRKELAKSYPSHKRGLTPFSSTGIISHPARRCQFRNALAGPRKAC